MKPIHPLSRSVCFRRLKVLAVISLLEGCGMSSNAGMGLDYGTGCLEMGPNRGGWGEGYGETFKSPDGGVFKKTQDLDPHYASSYQNGNYQSKEGYPFYHPHHSEDSPNTEQVDPQKGPPL